MIGSAVVFMFYCGGVAGARSLDQSWFDSLTWPFGVGAIFVINTLSQPAAQDGGK